MAFKSRIPANSIVKDIRSGMSNSDLMEKGMQVSGVQAKVGDKKNFLIQADAFAAILPFTLEAHCRWVKPEAVPGLKVSGYEITGISDTNLASLRQAVEVFTFCDENNGT